MANFLADDQQDTPAAGGMASLFPPLPQHETHSTSESGSSAPVAAPEYTAAMNKVGAASQEQADTTEAKGQVESDVAQEMADEAKGQLAEFDKAAAEKAKISAAEDVKVRQASDYLKKDVQTLRQTPAPALFHDGDGWKNIAKAVALAVAGFGDALAAKGAALGGRSPSQNSVSNIVNMLVDQEKAHVQKLTDNVAMSKTGLADAKEAKATLMAAADAKGAEAMRRVQMLGDYMVKSKGPEGKVLQARLDALNTQQDMNKFQAQSLQSLHKTITGKHSTENIDRDQTAKPPGAGATPTEFTSGGVRFAVNPAETTPRLHAAGRGQLALIQGAIKNTEDVLKSLPDNEAPQSTIHAFFSGDQARADANAKLALIRNQMAAALKESMGETAAKERAGAVIPDVPQTNAGMPAFKAKLHAGVSSMHDQLGEVLHTTGGHAVGKSAPEQEIPGTSTAPPAPASSAAPGGKPSIDDLVKRAGGR